MTGKSKNALVFSVSRLVEDAVAQGQKVYLWTFTFPKVFDLKKAVTIWQCMSNCLTRQAKKGLYLRAVRVYELHPGGHGLHIHLVAASELPMTWVEKKWKAFGGGIVHAKLCTDLSSPDRLGFYLGKYLAKSEQLEDGSAEYDRETGQVKRCKALKGMRLWGTLGHKGVRVKDVESKNARKTFFEQVKALDHDGIQSSLQHLVDLKEYRQAYPECGDGKKALKSANWRFLRQVTELWREADEAFHVWIAKKTLILNPYISWTYLPPEEKPDGKLENFLTDAEGFRIISSVVR